MELTHVTECKCDHLCNIFGNLELLLKLSPPQIKYEVVDIKEGIFKQAIPIKKIKKIFELEVKHKKISDNSFLLEIINGPLKKTKINVIFEENNQKTNINLQINLKLGLQYKLFSSIITEKLNSVNLTLVKRLENFSRLLFNEKFPITFENNFSTLIVEINQNEKIFFDGWWLGDVYSTFIGKIYEKLNFKNKIVVDVGSNIADSSIYFAVFGAKKVIGLEPFPKNYNFGHKNVQRNSLAEKIDLLLSGCSSKSDEIKIDPELSGLSYKMEETDSGKIIKQTTLTELCDSYNIDGGVLKMNCEGCEYDIILNTSENILKKFSQILIRYHDNSEKLIERLSKIGFKIIDDKHSIKKGQIFAIFNS